MPPVITADTQLIIDWIAQAGWDGRQELGYPPLPGPEILDAPDRALFITIAPGPGYITEEGSADAVSFQARFRGPEDDPAAPDAAARQFERMVLAASFPVQVDGTWIQHVHRDTTPVPLPLAPDDRRFEVTVTYTIVRGS